MLSFQKLTSLMLTQVTFDRRRAVGGSVRSPSCSTVSSIYTRHGSAPLVQCMLLRWTKTRLSCPFKGMNNHQNGVLIIVGLFAFRRTVSRASLLLHFSTSEVAATSNMCCLSILEVSLSTTTTREKSPHHSILVYILMEIISIPAYIEPRARGICKHNSRKFVFCTKYRESS